MPQAFEEGAAWQELVARTRTLVRAIGLAEFDDGFFSPELLCDTPIVVQAYFDNPQRDPSRPENFRQYLRSALSFLAALSAATATQAFKELNQHLVDPVGRPEVAAANSRVDLLDAQAYRAIEMVRSTLRTMADQLGWLIDDQHDDHGVGDRSL